MFYVTSLDGSQVEPLHGWGTDFNLSQSVDGTLTVSSTVLNTANNPGYNVLASEAVVTIDDLNFRVKQFSPGIGSKQFTAVSDFFDHSATWIHDIFEGSHTAANHAQFALAGTGWTAIVDSSLTGTNAIPNFGNDNAVALIQKLCKYHQCEFAILPNNRIYLAKQIGPDNDYQFRYKHNVSDVVLKEDTSNLRTHIKGYGKDSLMVEYTSPNEAVFGFREAEPVRDERFTDADVLLNYIKTKLQDEPKIAIETRIPELVGREIGERVWLFYEPLNVAIQTRILKQNKTLVRVDGKLKLITSSVVLGNTLIKDAGDDIVEQQEQINDTKENLNETKEELTEAKSEYRSEFIKTDERITLEVEKLDESIATVDIKADNIDLSVNNRITEEMGLINVRADNIEISVSDLSTNTSSAITVLKDDISLKIDKGGAITDINLTPGVATINAAKINLNGAVMVNGSIGGATTITVTTDINLGQTLRFSDFTTVSGYYGDLHLEAVSTIYYGAKYHYFYGNVDFSNANVYGLPAAT